MAFALKQMTTLQLLHIFTYLKKVVLEYTSLIHTDLRMHIFRTIPGQGHSYKNIILIPWDAIENQYNL